MDDPFFHSGWGADIPIQESHVLTMARPAGLFIRDPNGGICAEGGSRQ